MSLRKSLVVGLEERAILFEGGRPVRMLPPGTHHFWSWQDVQLRSYKLAEPLGDPTAEIVAVLGREVETIDVAADERAVLLERGVPVRRLPPGRHVFWAHRSPGVERFQLAAPEAAIASMKPQVRALLAEDLVVVDVGEGERVALLVDQAPVRALPPGRHGFWNHRTISVVRHPVDALVVDLPPLLLALFSHEVETVRLERTERGVVTRRRRPVRWLGAGVHTLWRHPDVALERLDLSGVAAKPLDAELRALVPSTEYTELTVPEGAMGVRFVDGAIAELLPPGRHAAFTVEHEVSQLSIDLRERVVTVQGQELLTKDKVTVRVNAALTYRVLDPRTLVRASKSADELLYLAVQLGLRDQLSRHTLDEVLADRAILDDHVRPLATARALELGLEVVAFGVKDLILPGDMRALLNKVIEAQKSAEANVIMRREETAAVRSMAQTAKLLAENPVLLRLKELEAYRELAEKVGTLHVVLGGEGLPKLELKS